MFSRSCPREATRGIVRRFKQFESLIGKTMLQDLTPGCPPARHPCMPQHFSPSSLPPTPVHLIAISILAINCLSSTCCRASSLQPLRTELLFASTQPFPLKLEKPKPKHTLAMYAQKPCLYPPSPITKLIESHFLRPRGHEIGPSQAARCQGRQGAAIHFVGACPFGSSGPWRKPRTSTDATISQTKQHVDTTKQHRQVLSTIIGRFAMVKGL